jgi:hypothetical protein
MSKRSVVNSGYQSIFKQESQFQPTGHRNFGKYVAQVNVAQATSLNEMLSPTKALAPSRRRTTI